MRYKVNLKKTEEGYSVIARDKPSTSSEGILKGRFLDSKGK